MLVWHWMLGMAAMIALLFFAITGFLLNHAEAWEIGTPRTTTRELRLPAPPAGETWDGDAAIVAALRADAGLRGAPEKPETRDGRLWFVFKSPGLRQEVSLDPKTGAGSVETETRGVVGRLLEFHRGKDAGGAWRLAADICAVLLATVTLSGFWLWAATPAWRVRGVVGLALSLGALGAALVCSW